MPSLTRLAAATLLMAACPGVSHAGDPPKGKRTDPGGAVAVDLRLMTVADGLGDWFARDEGPFTNPERRRAGRHLVAAADGPVFLADAELVALLVEAQGDRGTDVKGCPRLTAFDRRRVNGRACESRRFMTAAAVRAADGRAEVALHGEEVELGASFSVRPAVSADRKAVAVEVKVELAHLVSVERSRALPGRKDGPLIEKPRVERLAFSKSARVPDGLTMLVQVGRVTRERRYTDYEPRFMEDVPFVGELFRVSRRSETVNPVFLLVTVRVGDGGATKERADEERPDH